MIHIASNPNLLDSLYLHRRVSSFKPFPIAFRPILNPGSAYISNRQSDDLSLIVIVFPESLALCSYVLYSHLP